MIYIVSYKIKLTGKSSNEMFFVTAKSKINSTLAVTTFGKRTISRRLSKFYEKSEDFEK